MIIIIALFITFGDKNYVNITVKKTKKNSKHDIYNDKDQVSSSLYFMVHRYWIPISACHI